MIYINNHNNDKFYDILFYNKDGKYHRINGPAVISGNYQAWYLNDIQYNESEIK